jgi:hypothetical protein
MHRLLPFRQYDEKDVINLFSLDVSQGAGTDYINLKAGKETFLNGGNWSGAAVKVDLENADLDANDPALGSDSYLGAIGEANQGPYAYAQGNPYPTAPLKVQVSGTDDAAATLGITLRSTLAYDENTEKLLYYNVKKDELQCVIPGEVVPVVTKGIFTFTAKSFAGDPAVGSAFSCSASGKFEVSNENALGRVLAKGTHDASPIYLVQFDANLFTSSAANSITTTTEAQL